MKIYKYIEYCLAISPVRISFPPIIHGISGHSIFVFYNKIIIILQNITKYYHKHI